MSAKLVPYYENPSPCMRKLDRLGWSAGLVFESYGVKVGIRTNDDSILPQLHEHLPPGRRELDSPVVDYLVSLRVGGSGGRPGLRHYSLLYGGLCLIGRCHDPHPLLGLLEGNIPVCVAAAAEDRAFVHAGVVGWKGRAIVIPGVSMSGKSTLVAELVHAGASYYSDEFAVLDGQGRVHPYPRRLTLRQSDGPPRRVLPEELGSRAGDRPLPISVVAVTRYRNGARWQPRPLSPGKAALEVMFHTVPNTRRPELAPRALGEAMPAARTIASVRGDAREAAEALLQEAER